MLLKAKDRYSLPSNLSITATLFLYPQAKLKNLSSLLLKLRLNLTD